MNLRLNKSSLYIFIVFFLFGGLTLADPPSSYDLRDVGGQNYVTSVKSQQGGTCWTHGAMASIEGNMLMTGAWVAAGESGEPNMAEYHLDWWNGFNENNNDDIDPPSGAGLVVHEGGDYRVTSAYLSRGEGAVRDIDGQSYGSPPLRFDASYHYYYVSDIEWYTVGTDLSNINTVKEKIMTEGVVGTSLCYDGSFMSNYIHYQPPTSELDPNHAVALIGWDDDLVTQAPLPGAWLVKNSWGSTWGNDGYFWISYYDKHCGHHPEMGAISFQDVEPMSYDKIYYHDYHGWRDTKIDCDAAFNAFNATADQVLQAVSFFTAADSVEYTVTVYGLYDFGTLSNELATKTGMIEYSGFHTIDLDSPLDLEEGDNFYIYIEFSEGGYPYDRTSDVPVLLGAKYRTIVESSSNPGESYYLSGGSWYDFYDLDTTANFCIKGLVVDNPPLKISLPVGTPQYCMPGLPVEMTVQIEDWNENYVPGSGTLYYRFDGGVFESTPLTFVESDLYSATMPSAKCGELPEFYFSADGDGGSTVYEPSEAPTELYSVKVGWTSVLYENNFESSTGWSISSVGATSGGWECGVPVNDPDWDYDPETDGDGSGSCFLTENELGNTDVDAGSVILMSPIFDMSVGGDIEYDYYLYLTDTDGAVDKLLVEINSEGGAGSWIPIALHVDDNSLNWSHHVIDEATLISYGVDFTSNMQLRFTANDDNPQSIVEAGIDGLVVSYLECDNPMMCGDANGDEALNIFDITFVIQFLYRDGPAPDPLESADVNSDETINIFDVTYMIDYLYRDGPDPDCP